MIAAARELPPLAAEPVTVANVEPVLVSEPDAAALLAISQRTLFDLRARGEIAFVTVGPRVLYRPAALREFAASRERRNGA